jgi:endonuclease/exonuclease/phosphatase (EEP) superfamily protein YafD
MSPWTLCAACIALGLCASCTDDSNGTSPSGGGESARGGGSHSGAGSGGLAAGGTAAGGEASGGGEGGGAPAQAGAGGEAGAAVEPTTLLLSVMTLNTPDYPTALAVQDIVDAQADVVGLQEVTPADAAAICASLGPEWGFVQEDAPNTHAIVSRLPILQRIGVTNEPRGGIGATIEVAPGVRVHVFDTHGMWTPYGPYQLGLDGASVSDVLASEEAVRMPGLRELLELAAPHLESAEPAFLVGDFNAPSHLDYEPDVAWPTSVAPAEAGFVDSYAELHPDNAEKYACEFAIDDPGITWTQLAESEPEGCFDRIDFVYYSTGDATPLTSATIDVTASDHRAVLTRFEIGEPARAEAPRLELPRDGWSDIPRHPLLSWTPALETASQTLYLEPQGGSALTVDIDASHWIPPLLEAAKTYQFRVESTTPTGTISSQTWSFTTRAGGGVDPDKDSYAPGETITVLFDGAAQALDWIGLHPRSSSYGAGSTAVWKYTNDSTTAPGGVVASGTVTLVAPQAAGSYALRFFDDDGYTVEDEVLIAVE